MMTWTSLAHELGNVVPMLQRTVLRLHRDDLPEAERQHLRTRLEALVGRLVRVWEAVQVRAQDDGGEP